MTEIVLVHGIQHEQGSAGELELAWLPALAGGLQKVGRGDLAEGVWHRGRAGSLDVRMAFYGDAFLAPEGEGLTPLQQQEIERGNDRRQRSIAICVLENVVRNSEDPGQRAAAAEELARLRAEPPESMGVKSVARSVAHALLDIPCLGGPAFAALGVVKPPVRQLSRYFVEPGLRRGILTRVGAHIDEGTKVVIAHSLGCVVAYEALWERADDPHRSSSTALLLTIGSPLGLGPIHRKLFRRPLGPPAGVRGWVNIADPTDFVAAHHDHARLFPDPHREDPARRTEMTGVPLPVDNGAEPHTGTHYLTKKVCAYHVAKALDPDS